jgi:hypothetical protein
MKKYLLSPIAGAAAIFFFFMPWVSCGNMMKWSGLELASGSGGDNMMGQMGAGGDSAVSGDPLLWGIPLAGIAIVGIYLLCKKRNRLASGLIPTIVIALIGIFVMSLTYIKVQDQKAKMSEEMGNMGKGIGESLSDTSEAPPSTGGDFGSMMGGMGIQIEWGFWLTALSLAVAAAGATQYRDLPKRPEDITTTATEPVPPPGEVVASTPPPDASMTEDKGMT